MYIYLLVIFFGKTAFLAYLFFLCVFSGLFLENLNQEKILHILKPLMAYFEKKNISSDRRGSLYFFYTKIRDQYTKSEIARNVFSILVLGSYSLS